jgi:dTDP-4-amino-4,6-dideoxygalactose transaminase
MDRALHPVSLRAQPPVYSPLSARAIAAGIQAALAGGDAARAEIGAALTARYQASALALTDSGTSALALAFRLAVARRPGHPVLLPAWACFDLATAVLVADVRVLFYDVDPATLGPDWRSLEAAARHEPAAAVAVHFYGIPIDWTRFESVIRPSGATIIEDAAQGVGAEIGNRPAGSLGDLAVLSFGRGKGTTGGSGGALLVHEPAFVEGVERLVLPAPRGGATEAVALTAQWILTRPSLFRIPAGLPWLGVGQTVFRAPHPIGGLTSMAAGVLGLTLPMADAETEARRRNAAALELRLCGSRLELIQAGAGARPGWLRMPARLKTGDVQALGRDSRARSLGIYPSYPKSLVELPGMAERLTERTEGFPGARELTERLLTLPTHSAVHAVDMQRIVAWAGGTP